jgi:hypothetical protein
MQLALDERLSGLALLSASRRLPWLAGSKPLLAHVESDCDY